MALQEEFHLNDEGTAIEFEIYDGDVGVDISGATVKTARFKPEVGAVKPVTLAFTTDGTDFLARWVTTAGWLDEVGTWKGQAFIRLPSGAWFTSKIEFVVYENI